MYLYHNPTQMWQLIAVLQCGEAVVGEADFGSQIAGSTPLGIRFWDKNGQKRAKKPNFFSENTRNPAEFEQNPDKIGQNPSKNGKNRLELLESSQNRLESLELKHPLWN